MKPATILPPLAGGPARCGLLLALAACNGSTVVTLTSTPSTDTFLTYRVGLVSIQLQTFERQNDGADSAVEHHAWISRNWSI